MIKIVLQRWKKALVIFGISLVGGWFYNPRRVKVADFLLEV